MTNLKHHTPLRFEYENGAVTFTTWGEFATVNESDADLLEEVRESLDAEGVAMVGGGAAPLIRISI